MKLGTLPDNLAEWIALRAGIIPPGVFESWFGIMLSRTMMVATRLDVFEALADAPRTAAEVAVRCKTHPLATEKLLNALVRLRCLRVRGERYTRRKSARESTDEGLASCGRGIRPSDFHWRGLRVGATC